MPLPDGGVLISHRDTLSAFTSEGDLLWEEEQDSYLISWALAEDALVFITSNDEAPLMTADAEGLYPWDDALTGIPIVSDGQAWLYAEDGLYRLNLTAHTAQHIYDLPTAMLRRSTALAQSDGGLLLLHADSADRRLLSFDADGELRWEFSVPLDGTPQLFELDGDIYLLNKPSFSSRGAYKALEVFLVDLEQERLFRSFQEGSRTFNPRTSWVASVSGEQLLIHIAGTGRVLFDPETALDRMGQ